MNEIRQLQQTRQRVAGYINEERLSVSGLACAFYINLSLVNSDVFGRVFSLLFGELACISGGRGVNVGATITVLVLVFS